MDDNDYEAEDAEDAEDDEEEAFCAVNSDHEIFFTTGGFE